ncbi:glutamine synthetase, catalytic region [Pseudovibrio sp. FO-BEG1]|uniref:glutamine synthetase family protein n=1 Tax=Pseudovibrio sp. (strain FO-BEG1) TaxID=911045 RepID=UPI000238D22A|nr:glutamine synthetase family protein [Pseudovibrio sp. FO-BEG1]AEV38710.1 glutamine synthetase, catalytic region [Pseudovibrio sp. FO-BEG1]
MTQFSQMQSASKDALAKQIGQLKQRGVHSVITQVPDMNGLLRCRLQPLDGLEKGCSTNSSLYLIPHGDGQPAGELIYESPHVWYHTGFGNLHSLADSNTLFQLGWRPGISEVLLNCYNRDGTRFVLDVRRPLEMLEERLAEMQLTMKVGLEFELGIFHFDRALVEAGEHHKLKPFGHSLQYDSVNRDPDYMDLMDAFRERMEGLGIGVSSMESEIGWGMYEVALEPASPLQAADNAVRARHHLKELCRERGLIATFMARYQPMGQDSANGTHVHVSLYDEMGHNIFYDKDAALSERGRHFVAGLLAQMKASHLAFRPTINSYRRLSRFTGCPEEVCWGEEHRVSAVRVISSPDPQVIRLEHRCSGADTHPYIILALIGAAGLDGLEHREEPPAMLIGDPGKDEDLEKLPRSLEESLELFRDSEFVQQALGVALADQYARSRENELKAFRAWIEKDITSFEFLRYFEGV